MSPEKHLARILQTWSEGGDRAWISPEMESALEFAERDFDGVEEHIDNRTTAYLPASSVAVRSDCLTGGYAHR